MYVHGFGWQWPRHDNALGSRDIDAATVGALVPTTKLAYHGN